MLAARLSQVAEILAIAVADLDLGDREEKDVGQDACGHGCLRSRSFWVLGSVGTYGRPRSGGRCSVRAQASGFVF